MINTIIYSELTVGGPSPHFANAWRPIPSYDSDSLLTDFQVSCAYTVMISGQAIESNPTRFPVGTAPIRFSSEMEHWVWVKYMI